MSRPVITSFGRVIRDPGPRLIGYANRSTANTLVGQSRRREIYQRLRWAHGRVWSHLLTWVAMRARAQLTGDPVRETR